jgi:hypothetical protein
MRLMGLFTPMPNIPKQGEPLLSYNLTALAYRDPASIIELMKYVVNLALENEINFLHIPLDPDTPAATVLSRFRHSKVKLHFFMKSLKQIASSLGERKLYIDVSEI